MGVHDIQHNDTQHNGIQHNDIQHYKIKHNNKSNTTLSIMTDHTGIVLLCYTDTQHNDSQHTGRVLLSVILLSVSKAECHK